MRDLDQPMPIQPHPYLARMARFTDGPEHDLRRAEVLAVLPAIEGLEEAAFSRAAVGLPDLVDAAPIARAVPVAVLGDALGVGDLTEKIGALCDYGTVCDGLPGLAFTSVLFQCRDATTALALMTLGDNVPLKTQRRSCEHDERRIYGCRSRMRRMVPAPMLVRVASTHSRWLGAWLTRSPITTSSSVAPTSNDVICGWPAD